MNSITIIGNVTREPELRSTPNGVSVCTFSVAVNNKYKPDEDAIFFRVTAWRKLAENCGKFIVKGMKVAVVGSVRPNEYEVNGEKRFNIEIQADDVEFLSKTDGGAKPKNEPPEVPRDQQSGYEQVNLEDDDLPF